jgi:hypothetical protein
MAEHISTTTYYESNVWDIDPDRVTEVEAAKQEGRDLVLLVQGLEEGWARQIIK